MKGLPKPSRRGRKPKKPLPRAKRVIGWRRREAKAASTVTDEQREKILIAFGRRCAYCRTRMASEWDHRVPISRGGKDEPANLVPACFQCNRIKGTQTWPMPLGHPFAGVTKCQECGGTPTMPGIHLCEDCAASVEQNAAQDGGDD